MAWEHSSGASVLSWSPTRLEVPLSARCRVSSAEVFFSRRCLGKIRSDEAAVDENSVERAWQKGGDRKANESESMRSMSLDDVFTGDWNVLISGRVCLASLNKKQPTARLE